MVKKRIPPVHPGAYLKELLDELALSQYRLAKDIGVPAIYLVLFLRLYYDLRVSNDAFD